MWKDPTLPTHRRETAKFSSNSTVLLCPASSSNSGSKSISSTSTNRRQVATISCSSLNEDTSGKGKSLRDAGFLILELRVLMMKKGYRPDSHRAISEISILRIQHSRLGIAVITLRNSLNLSYQNKRLRGCNSCPTPGEVAVS